jgi:hypothetical protein
MEKKQGSISIKLNKNKDIENLLTIRTNKNTLVSLSSSKRYRSYRALKTVKLKPE